MSPKPCVRFSNDSGKNNFSGQNRFNKNGRFSNRNNPNKTPKNDNKQLITDTTAQKTTNVNKDQNDKTKERSPFNVRCLNCWRLGHMMRDCTGPDSEELRCYEEKERP